MAQIRAIISAAAPFGPLAIEQEAEVKPLRASKPYASRKREGERVGGKTLEQIEEGGGDGPPDDPPSPAIGPDEGGRPPPEIIEASAAEPLNDTGNGKRLLHHFGDSVLHVREVGWHAWSTTHWERDGAGEACERYAQITAARIALEADMLAATPRGAAAIEAGRKAELELAELRKVALLDEDKRARGDLLERAIERADYARAEMQKRKIVRRKYAVSSGNGGKIENMIKRALPHRTVAPVDLDADPLALNVENGTLRFFAEPDPECPDPDVVRLKWGVRLDPHAREDMISKVAPVFYDPAATCPEWDAFLDLVQPEARVRDFLRDYHGYALTGLTDAQVFVFNWGSGANGKSTFIEAMARLFGAYGQTLNPESFTGASQRRGDQATPDLADLVGARLLRVSELPERSPLQDNLVKAITGGEPMKVRHLNLRFFLFRPVFKASMSGNTKPNIQDISEGMWRRLMLVPWLVMIPAEVRRGFEEMQSVFAAERSGILNWLIAGCLSYLDSRRLYPPEEVLAATAEHRDELDPVGQFIEACLVRIESKTISAGKLYEYYYAWCIESGLKPWNATAFGRAMPKHKLGGEPIAKRKSGEQRTINYQDMAVLPSAPAPRTPTEGMLRGS